MIIFQAPAGTPEHNSLAVKIGTWIEQHLKPGFAVLYDTYTYVPNSELEKMAHFDRSAKLLYSDALKVEFPID